MITNKDSVSEQGAGPSSSDISSCELLLLKKNSKRDYYDKVFAKNVCQYYLLLLLSSPVLFSVMGSSPAAINTINKIVPTVTPLLLVVALLLLFVLFTAFISRAMSTTDFPSAFRTITFAPAYGYGNVPEIQV